MPTQDPNLPVICCFFDAALYNQQDTAKCEEEVQTLRKLYQAAKLDEHLSLHILERAGASDLEQALSQYGEDIQILHYVGTERTFNHIMHNFDLPDRAKNLHLFFYNYCHSEEEARLLVEKNIPVVIACSSELDTAYALAFTERFYICLLQGLSIQESFKQAKDAVQITASIYESAEKVVKRQEKKTRGFKTAERGFKTDPPSY